MTRPKPSSPLPANPPTLDGVFPLLDAINNRAKALRVRPDGTSYENWDTRFRYAQGIEAATAIAMIQMRFLVLSEGGRLYAQKGANVLAPANFAQIAGIKSEVPAAVESYRISLRLNFVLAVQFQVERTLNDLARALNVPEVRRIEAQAHALLDHCRVSAPRTRASWIYVPSLMRNTLHNGGIHGGKDRTITVGDHSYRFRKGKPYLEAAWSHIFHSVSAEIDAISELFESTSVMDLGSVPDKYAFYDAVGYMPRRNVYSR